MIAIPNNFLFELQFWCEINRLCAVCIRKCNDTVIYCNKISNDWCDYVKSFVWLVYLTFLLMLIVTSFVHFALMLVWLGMAVLCCVQLFLSCSFYISCLSNLVPHLDACPMPIHIYIMNELWQLRPFIHTQQSQFIYHSIFISVDCKQFMCTVIKISHSTKVNL